MCRDYVVKVYEQATLGLWELFEQSHETLDVARIDYNVRCEIEKSNIDTCVVLMHEPTQTILQSYFQERQRAAGLLTVC